MIHIAILNIMIYIYLSTFSILFLFKKNTMKPYSIYDFGTMSFYFIELDSFFLSIFFSYSKKK
jgi:hypothetical protein